MASLVYLDKFFKLKSSGDILNVVAPLTNGAKEITEAMAIIERIRPISLENKMGYVIVDLCAGNALSSIIAMHLLPISYAWAINKRKPNRRYHKVRSFSYLKCDILNDDSKVIDILNSQEDIIIVSIHPCKQLALKVCEYYNTYDTVKHLLLMPCCVGKNKQFIKFAKDINCSKDVAWVEYLKQLVKGAVSADSSCLSKANFIIEAHKQ